MTAPVTAPAFAPQLAAIGDSFAAWRSLYNGSCQPFVITATTLDAAVEQACAGCFHKDVLFVLHTAGLSGKSTLHIFAIKQRSRPNYVRSSHGAHFVQQRPLYADKITSIQVDAFAPVEPWRWMPGSDVVGADRNVVGARP
jgi:hypothetical protein